MTRVMVFIDGSNLYWSFKNFTKTRSDGRAVCNIKRLVQLLTDERDLVRAYFFGSVKVPRDPNAKPKEAPFLDWLKKAGIQTEVYPIKIRSETFKCPHCNYVWKEQFGVEKGVDVALVTDLLALGFKGGYDVAVIVAGDADYVEAIKEVKDLGRRVEVAAFKDSAAQALIETADKFIPLDAIADQLIILQRRRARRPDNTVERITPQKSGSQGEPNGRK